MGALRPALWLAIAGLLLGRQAGSSPRWEFRRRKRVGRILVGQNPILLSATGERTTTLMASVLGHCSVGKTPTRVDGLGGTYTTCSPSASSRVAECGGQDTGFAKVGVVVRPWQRAPIGGTRGDYRMATDTRAGRPLTRAQKKSSHRSSALHHHPMGDVPVFYQPSEPLLIIVTEPAVW